ncbi:hypothetical protein RhoFasGS6_03922 [Rhodococcus fascians]|uniref:hypothetical protein n=1 Tax=Rhodococcoides fascians TaxID=1828 RepID=UPI001427A170|nr:hypothetical protein [Rhodococcus fascians]
MTALGIPLLFTVQLHTAIDSARDAHNNAVRSYAAPTEHKVFGWSVPSSSEPSIPGQSNRVIHDLELLAPEGLPATAHDRMTVDGNLYDVQGDPADFNHGPFGFRPGIVVKLKRVTG